MKLRPVWVIGEALVDVFSTGAVPGGAPFNVARTLSGMGLPVRFISRVGRDELADMLLESASTFGLSIQDIQRDDLHPTGLVTVVQQDLHHQFEISSNSAWDYIEDVDFPPSSVNEPPAMVYFGTLAQRHLASRRSIRKLLSKTDALRFLDLNLRNGPDNLSLASESLHLADWVKVNDEELDQILVWFGKPEMREPGWREGNNAEIALLMQKFSLKQLVVTRGAAGYLCFGSDGNCLEHGAGRLAPTTVVDTVGAGDGFSAGLIAATVYGHSLKEALSFANQYAADVCSHAGPLRNDPASMAPWRALVESGSRPADQFS